MYFICETYDLQECWLQSGTEKEWRHFCKWDSFEQRSALPFNRYKKTPFLLAPPYPVNAESGFVDSATTFERGETGKILGV